jgi:hypothetical protein
VRNSSRESAGIPLRLNESNRTHLTDGHRQAEWTARRPKPLRARIARPPRRSWAAAQGRAQPSIGAHVMPTCIGIDRPSATDRGASGWASRSPGRISRRRAGRSHCQTCDPLSVRPRCRRPILGSGAAKPRPAPDRERLRAGGRAGAPVKTAHPPLTRKPDALTVRSLQRETRAIRRTRQLALSPKRDGRATDLLRIGGRCARGLPRARSAGEGQRVTCSSPSSKRQDYPNPERHATRHRTSRRAPSA